MYCSHREFPTTICCAEARINLLREALACTGLVAEDADTGFIYLVLKENLCPSALCTSLGKSYPESCSTISIPNAFLPLWYLHVQGTLLCIS